MTAALFPQPIDVHEAATALLDDKFFAAAYMVMGKRERWQACAAQLPELFMEFMWNEIPDYRLYQLTALMFQWAHRFFDDAHGLREQLIKNLDFIDQNKLAYTIFLRQAKTYDGKYEWRHPWQPTLLPLAYHRTDGAPP